MSSRRNTIKRAVIDGKSIILLEGPPQILSWADFKRICNLFDDTDWHDIADVTGADFNLNMQVVNSLTLRELSQRHQITKETLAYLNALGVATPAALRELTEPDINQLRLPMNQKRCVAGAVAQLLAEAGRPPLALFRSKSNSGGGGGGGGVTPGGRKVNIDGALSEHPKFWADHISSSKLIKLL